MGPRAAAGAELRVLILGDSLTAGYGLSVSDSLPAQMEAALRGRGHDVRVINGGVSGDTSAGGRSRIDWALAATPPPDAVIVELGGNDGLRGIAPGVTRENLDFILSRIAAAGLPALLLGMKAPRNFGPDYVKEFEQVFPALARKYDVLFDPFILEGVALERTLNQPDGLHPNAEGVARIVHRLLPLLEQLVARARRADPAPAPAGTPSRAGPP